MPKVSVIIPVYNTEKYLKRCLDSVISQTFDDIEIICVDDCSDDNSRKILTQYAENDKRIKVLYTEQNSGQSFSRNKAIDNAKGEYICFLDSDDYLLNDAIEKFYNISSENNLDILKVCCMLEDDNAYTYIPCESQELDGKIYTGVEILKLMAYKNIFSYAAWSTWSNFIRRKFLIAHSITFYNNIIHEDILYTYQVLLHAKKCMTYMSDAKYVYVYNPDSTVNKPSSFKHAYGLLRCMHEILKETSEKSCNISLYVTFRHIADIYNKYRLRINTMNENIDLSFLDEDLHFAYLLTDNRFIDINIMNTNTEQIRSSEKIIVYGAGAACEELLKILSDKEISIYGIAVSDMNKSKSAVMGHRVHNIDYYENDKDAVVLVAISKHKVGNLLENLKSRGFNNIIYVCKENNQI